MTAKELIDIAESLCPEKLKNDPHAALTDAYQFGEALALLSLERAITESPSPGPQPTANGPAPTDLVGALRAYQADSNISIRTLADQMRIPVGSLYQWFSGRAQPGPKWVEQVKEFLGQ